MVFRGLKEGDFRPPRKLDWHLIVAKGAVVMGLGSVDSGHVVQSLGDRLGRGLALPFCRGWSRYWVGILSLESSNVG